MGDPQAHGFVRWRPGTAKARPGTGDSTTLSPVTSELQAIIDEYVRTDDADGHPARGRRGAKRMEADSRAVCTPSQDERSYDGDLMVSVSRVAGPYRSVRSRRAKAVYFGSICQ